MNQTKPIHYIDIGKFKPYEVELMLIKHDHSNYIKFDGAFKLTCKNKEFSIHRYSLKSIETIILDLILDFNRK